MKQFTKQEVKLLDKQIAVHKKAWGKLTPTQQQAQLAAATKKLNAAFGVR